ncbi:DUF5808 domain-containing protein [Daejeonella sp.]|uniref:DUF5808 domain-containing protein n=1 Tax=Daejeonella sp. TaxID=2805397 RepID=UPI0039830F12
MKAGLIYNNPNDPDVWVKKRIGLGWTLNFAHSRSYYIMGLFLLLTAAIVIFAICTDKS